jgi:acyl-CoA thioester hydrolase
MSRLKIEIMGNKLAVIKLHVRITDINYGNHLGNDAFVALIHEARMQWLHQYNFTELNIEGAGLIMSDLLFEFKSEVSYGEEIEIALTVADISKVSFDLFYMLTTTRNAEKTLVANAKTGMVCYDYKSKKVAAIPARLLEIFRYV